MITGAIHPKDYTAAAQDNSTGKAASGSDSQSPQTGDLTGLADKDTFLQLLVAQIKNQNPLNPTDGTQFVAQLAQFSELEQVMAIRKDIEIGPPAGQSTGANNTSGV